ncbi:hypothetical protein Tco_1075985 [Tanacetum coccineum]
MEHCTTLQSRVLALETTKTIQALEIDSLKRRVEKLEKKKRSRTHRLKRLYKVSLSAKVISSDDEGLDDHKDASKQGRIIDNIDADEGVTLVDETQGRNDEEMFNRVTTAGEVVTTISTAATITSEEFTLAQALMEIKTSNPKAKGIIFKESSESTTTTPTPIVTPQQSSQVKDKAKIEADQLLAKILQEREQEELTIEERSKLFQQLLEKKRKFFEAKRAEEKRNKPPTKAQQRSIMCTYLKNMAGYKQSQLKNKSFAKIQNLFDKAMTRVNMFVDMETQLVKESSKKAEAEMA